MGKASGVTVSPGMKNAMAKLPPSGRKCSGCGLVIPSYQGRYPLRCSNCGTELSFGEKFSKAVEALYLIGLLVEVSPMLQDKWALAALKLGREKKYTIKLYLNQAIESLDKAMKVATKEKLPELEQLKKAQAILQKI